MANKYYLNDERQATPTLLIGEPYIFNLGNPANAGHPILFSVTPNGTHTDGGVVYNGEEIGYFIDDLEVSYEIYINFMNNEFNPDKNPQVRITPTESTPTPLYYFCLNHSKMGGELNIISEIQFRNAGEERLRVREGVEVAPEVIDVRPGPRLNHCCDGASYQCLMECIMEKESGGEGPEDFGYRGCNSAATDCGNCDFDGDGRKDPQKVQPGDQFDSDCNGTDDCTPGDPCDVTCDCGPYQISHRQYIDDICGGGIPTPEAPGGGTNRPCRGGDPGGGPAGNPGYDTANCCEVCEAGYAESLCVPCPQGDDACCTEKKRRSEKLIDCWRRRFTRNPGSDPDFNRPGPRGNRCYCTGQRNHDYPDGDLPCCTCEDLARMHNGGPCGHLKRSTDGYWRDVSACMRRKGCITNPVRPGKNTGLEQIPAIRESSRSANQTEDTARVNRTMSSMTPTTPSQPQTPSTPIGTPTPPPPPVQSPPPSPPSGGGGGYGGGY